MDGWNVSIILVYMFALHTGFASGSRFSLDIKYTVPKLFMKVKRERERDRISI